MSEEIKKYIFSENSSDDLKKFFLGLEDGYSKGHDTGFAKGLAVGIIGTIAAFVALVMKD